MRRAARVDANQSEIVAALRKIGAVVLITSQLKNLFDIIVCFDSKVYLVEIKDGDKPPSQRKLTSGELDCKELIESVGVEYHVINNTQEAMKLIGKLK